MFLNNSQNSQQNIYVGVFLTKLRALRTVCFLERDSCETAEIFKNTFSYRLPRVAASAACNFIKKEIPAKIFFCEFGKISKNIFWQSTSRWLPLKFICEFWEVFQNSSFRTPLRNCLFNVQVAVFQPADTVKNYFKGAYSSTVYKNTRSSHPKAFIYLKYLKIICEEVNL